MRMGTGSKGLIFGDGVLRERADCLTTVLAIGCCRSRLLKIYPKLACNKLGEVDLKADQRGGWLHIGPQQ